MMVNKSGNIGTATETVVARACQKAGFQFAKSTKKTGARDTADVTITNNVIAQVKGGVMAGKASTVEIDTWWMQTLTQAENYCNLYHTEVHAVLVVKKKGVGPKYAHMWPVYFTQNMNAWSPLVMVRLGDYLYDLRNHKARWRSLVGEPLREGYR